MEAIMDSANFQKLFGLENKIRSLEDRLKSISDTFISLGAMTVMPKLSVRDDLTPVLDAAITKMHELGKMSVTAPLSDKASGNGAAASAEKSVDFSKSFGELSDLFKSTHDFLDNFSVKEKPVITCNCICGIGAGGGGGKKGKGKGGKGKGGKGGSDNKGAADKDIGGKQGKGGLFQKAFKLTTSPKMLKGLKVAASGANLLGKAIRPLGIVTDIATIVKSDNKREALKKVGASNLGAVAGATIGSMLLPGVGTVAGGIIGSYAPELFKLGKAGFRKLFKKNNEKKPAPTVPNSIKAITLPVTNPMTSIPPSIPVKPIPGTIPIKPIPGMYQIAPSPAFPMQQSPINLNIANIGVDISTQDIDFNKIANEVSTQLVSELKTAMQNRI